MTGPGHNGGPPLEDHVPEWGRNGIGGYFAWKRAHARVWREVSWETMIRRQRRAELIGLSYDEHALEILERGRHLGPADVERIEAIKKARRAPKVVGGEGVSRDPARPGLSPQPETERPTAASLGSTRR